MINFECYIFIHRTKNRRPDAQVYVPRGRRIKQVPEKVKDAAVEVAEEVVEEIKATPGRVAKQTKEKVKVRAEIFNFQR